ncbi:MAG TPA: DNA-formamidopyrimidine glycosylase family protein, partial [Polyangiaceae bacterium]|nr:DNA-formamidopyrimidine glycosylase family protein [Polyangiaceae bacterium]
MPEGDSLHRTARTLNRVLAQQRLVRVRSSVAAVAGAELAGHVVTEVSARGKNLLIRFDDGRVLHTHLRMHGSWHVYRPGERFQRPEHQARVVLEVADALAVCFSAPTVRLLSARALENDPYLTGLGPDLIPDEFDETRAVQGLLALGDLSVGEAVMTQTALAGIGNIWKSETLFLCNKDPFALVSGLSHDKAAEIVNTARRLLRASVGSLEAQGSVEGGRGRFWVYDRSGQACRKCGSTVHMERQGTQPRSTYFCPQCQGV